MIPIIDTNQAIKRLTKVKFTKDQAEEVVDLVGQANDALATKGDLKELRKDLEVLGTQLTSEIKAARLESESGVDAARKDMEMLETRLVGSISELRKDVEALNAISEANFAKLQRSFTLQIFGAIGLLFVILQFFDR